MSAGENIKKILSEKGMTIKGLSDITGIPLNTLYSITKRNSQNIRKDIAQALADGLGVSVDKLLYGFELDREYELICDTLSEAGYGVEQAIRADVYYVTPLADPDDPETRLEIEHSRLAQIVYKILADAENNKRAYIQKWLDAELFGWNT